MSLKSAYVLPLLMVLLLGGGAYLVLSDGDTVGPAAPPPTPTSSTARMKAHSSTKPGSRFYSDAPVRRARVQARSSPRGSWT